VGRPKTPQALALGAILIFGVAYLVAQGLADAAPAALTRRTARASLGRGLAYFTFQLGAETWRSGAASARRPAPDRWNGR
jgi:NAD(P)H-quinone oxidoreductase subunit 5